MKFFLLHFPNLSLKCCPKNSSKGISVHVTYLHHNKNNHDIRYFAILSIMLNMLLHSMIQTGNISPVRPNSPLSQRLRNTLGWTGICECTVYIGNTYKIIKRQLLGGMGSKRPKRAESIYLAVALP